MPAYVDYEFPKKFDLDEEKLRRIVELLKERIPAESHDQIKFQVSRRDSLIYNTDDISIVLSEDNDSTKIITSVKINYDDKSLKTSISFDDIRGCKISIEGEDRDRVFLLSSSLKEYIGKEVTTYFKLPIETRTIPTLFLILLSVYMIYLIASNNPLHNDSDISAALKSPNTNDKLNFLIENKNLDPNQLKKLTFPFIITTLLMATTILPLQKIISMVHPTNNFLFGKQKQVIAKKKDLNSKIFWGGIVATIIGVTISYLFTK